MSMKSIFFLTLCSTATNIVSTSLGLEGFVDKFGISVRAIVVGVNLRHPGEFTECELTGSEENHFGQKNFIAVFDDSSQMVKQLLPLMVHAAQQEKAKGIGLQMMLVNSSLMQEKDVERKLKLFDCPEHDKKADRAKTKFEKNKLKVPKHTKQSWSKNDRGRRNNFRGEIKKFSKKY